jgi:hypothetical protein
MNRERLVAAKRALLQELMNLTSQEYSIADLVILRHLLNDTDLQIDPTKESNDDT